MARSIRPDHDVSATNGSAFNAGEVRLFPILCQLLPRYRRRSRQDRRFRYQRPPRRTLLPGFPRPKPSLMTRYPQCLPAQKSCRRQLLQATPVCLCHCQHFLRYVVHVRNRFGKALAQPVGFLAFRAQLDLQRIGHRLPPLKLFFQMSFSLVALRKPWSSHRQAPPTCCQGWSSTRRVALPALPSAPGQGAPVCRNRSFSAFSASWTERSLFRKKCVRAIIPSKMAAETRPPTTKMEFVIVYPPP